MTLTKLKRRNKSLIITFKEVEFDLVLELLTLCGDIKAFCYKKSGSIANAEITFPSKQALKKARESLRNSTYIS